MNTPSTSLRCKKDEELYLEDFIVHLSSLLFSKEDVARLLSADPTSKNNKKRETEDHQGQNNRSANVSRNKRRLAFQSQPELEKGAVVEESASSTTTRTNGCLELYWRSKVLHKHVPSIISSQPWWASSMHNSHIPATVRAEKEEKRREEGTLQHPCNYEGIFVDATLRLCPAARINPASNDSDIIAKKSPNQRKQSSHFQHKQQSKTKTRPKLALFFGILFMDCSLSSSLKGSGWYLRSSDPLSYSDLHLHAKEIGLDLRYTSGESLASLLFDALAHLKHTNVSGKKDNELVKVNEESTSSSFLNIRHSKRGKSQKDKINSRSPAQQEIEHSVENKEASKSVPSLDFVASLNMYHVDLEECGTFLNWTLSPQSMANCEIASPESCLASRMPPLAMSMLLHNILRDTPYTENDSTTEVDCRTSKESRQEEKPHQDHVFVRDLLQQWLKNEKARYKSVSPCKSSPFSPKKMGLSSLVAPGIKPQSAVMANTLRHVSQKDKKEHKHGPQKEGESRGSGRKRKTVDWGSVSPARRQRDSADDTERTPKKATSIVAIANVNGHVVEETGCSEGGRSGQLNANLHAKPNDGARHDQSKAKNHESVPFVRPSSPSTPAGHTPAETLRVADTETTRHIATSNGTASGEFAPPIRADATGTGTALVAKRRHDRFRGKRKKKSKMTIGRLS